MVEGKMPSARTGGTPATRNKAETNPIQTQIAPNLCLLPAENVELGGNEGSKYSRKFLACGVEKVYNTILVRLSA